MTPSTPGRQLPSSLLNNAFRSPLRPQLLNAASDRSAPSPQGNIQSPDTVDPDTRDAISEERVGANDTPASFDGPSPIAIPGSASPRGTVDGSNGNWGSGDVTNYGSFIPSPGSRIAHLGPPSLELPDPALAPDEDAFAKHNRAWRHSRFSQNPHTTPIAQQIDGKAGDAYHVGKSHTPGKTDLSQLLPKHKRFLRPRRTVSTPHGGAPTARPRFIRRIFSSGGPGSPASDVPLEAYKAYDEKQADFFKFLDAELRKIEGFYKMKESEANERLQKLRDQLHMMRDRRMEEIRKEHEAKRIAKERQRQQAAGHENLPPNHGMGHNRSRSAALRWMQPIESAIGLGPSKIGKTSKALQKLGSPAGPIGQSLPGTNRPDSWRDFTRRPTQPDIPYRAAKRKLKLALQEFYRGLELLKSYALLNRTAFRKINKKYDKAVKARPTQRYMAEKVNKSWFVQSEVLDHQIVAIEDLYARYFERGNHKVAVGKLRSKPSKATDYTGSVFRNGMLIAGAAVFGIQGVVYGGEHLANPDPTIQIRTSYLLQVISCNPGASRTICANH